MPEKCIKYTYKITCMLVLTREHMHLFLNLFVCLLCISKLIVSSTMAWPLLTSMSIVFSVIKTFSKAVLNGC